MLTLAGVLASNSHSCAVMEATIDNLPKRAEKHNSMVEHTYTLEHG